LYHAEFSDWCPRALSRLGHISRKLVDQGLAPAAGGRVLPGVPSQLLHGAPRDGGFGLLPWREHVSARHAWWGAQLLLAVGSDAAAGPDAPLWVHAAAAQLRQLGGGHTHPAVVLSAALMRDEGAPLAPSVTGGAAGRCVPAGPLARLVGGLQALGRIQAVREVEPGPWCWAAPVWGNPLLPAVPNSNLALLPGCSTLGGVVALWDSLQPLMASQPVHQRQRGWEQWWAAQPGVLGSGLLRAEVLDRGACMERLQRLRDVIPAAWWEAAAAVGRGGSAPPTQAEALQLVGASLGWQRARAGGAAPLCVPLTALSVQGGTALQLGAVEERRAGAHAAFVAAAKGVPVAGVPASDVGLLQSSMAKAWGLPWENLNKEVWWRMAAHGVRGAGGHGIAASHACPCGGLAAGSCADAAREHCFWSCPVAEAVVASLQQAREAAAGGAQQLPVQRADVWLAQPPSAGSSVHEQVWLVVCLAAVSAMDYGRRRMVAEHLAAQPPGADSQGLRQLSLFEAWGLDAPAPAVSAAEVAGRSAVARFWALLADFCSVGLLPRGAQSVPLDGHPFLVRVEGPAGVGDRLVLVPLPEGLGG
jgi:hypothetical protein